MLLYSTSSMIVFFSGLIKMAKKIANKKKSNAGVKTNKVLTIVEQGPKDGLLRKDGYGSEIYADPTKYSNVIGKYADDLFASYADMNISLGKGVADLAKLPGLSKIAEIIKEYNPVSLLGRIEENVFGGVSLRSVYDKGMNMYKNGKQIYEDFKKDTVGALAKYGTGLNLAGLNVGEMVRTGRATYQDVRKIQNIVKNNDWGSLAGIMKGLNSIGNTALSNHLKGIVDIQAHTAFLGKAMRDAHELGLFVDKEFTQNFKQAFNELNTRNAGNQIVSTLYYNSAQNSDIGSMENIVSWLGGKQVLSNNPLAVETTLDNFSLLKGYTEKDAYEMRKRLLALLESVNPNWYKDYLGSEEVTHLGAFQKMSDDSKMLLSLEVPGEINFKTEVMLSGWYNPRNIKSIVLRDFKDFSFEEQ